MARGNAAAAGRVGNTHAKGKADRLTLRDGPEAIQAGSPRIAATPRSASAKRDRAHPASRSRRTSARREGKRPGWAVPAV